VARKYVDCREFPSDSRCSLRISGEEDEVVRAAAMHAVDVHGEHDGPELRRMLHGALHDEEAAGAHAHA
jgi:predicted small metal-binding protein